MPTLKSKQITAMTKDELVIKLSELRKEQIKLNTQVSSGTSIKNPSMVGKTRKTIARLTHALNNKEA
jgi:ribosomal protein L29